MRLKLLGKIYRKHNHFIQLTNTPLCLTLITFYRQWLVAWGARARNNETADFFFLLFFNLAMALYEWCQMTHPSFTIINV